VIWGLLSSLKVRKTWVRVVVGLLFALATQQAAFHLWRCALAGVWGPLGRFLSLQYLVIHSFGISVGKSYETKK